MRVHRTLFVSALAVAVALTLTGCPFVVVRPAKVVAAAAKPAAEPKSTACSRKPLEVAGKYVHAGSSIEFPASAGQWTRSAVDRYDREANDVGIGYHTTLGGAKVEATVYVFPRYWNSATEPMPLDEEFEGEKGEIRKAFGAVSDGPESSGTAAFRGAEIPGRTIEMTADDPTPFVSGRVVTILTTYAADPWRIKYRVTTPESNRDAARAALAELFTELALPPLVPPSATTTAAPTPPGGAPR